MKTRHHAALAAATAVVCAAIGCAKATAAPALEPAFERADYGDERAPAIVREGAPGTVVLFVRNVIDRDVQDVATDLADDFVTRCEPAYDAIAVVEPGIALAWPGIRARADEELARRRSWRARCLARRGDPADVAAERAKEQVQLVVDEHAEVRRDVLAGADPSGDIVVAAYGPRGEALSATRVDATAHYAARERVVAATIVAVARASGAPERATSSSPGPDRR